MKKFINLLLFVLLCEGAGAIGSVFTFPAISGWYAGLIKPSFTPPNYIFGPVWTILYFLMGVSLFLVWQNNEKKKKKEKSVAIKYFLAQLGINVLWSLVFFGLKSPLGAFIVIVLLWLLIFETIRKFAKVDQKASILLYPYLIWVTLASFLNFSILQLNGF